MCNNYYNVDKTDGKNGGVKDGDNFAGDGNDKEILPVPPRMTTTRLTWFPLYIWWLFCQICTYSLGSGLVGDLISWIRLKAQRKPSLTHICWLFKKENQINVKVCFVFALCTNHISLFISLVLSGRLPFCLGPFSLRDYLCIDVCI